MAFKKFWRPCESCGNDFLVKYAHRSDARFCSLTCSARETSKVRLAQSNEIRAQRAHEAKMAEIGRTKDDQWRALMAGARYDSVKVKPSLVPHVEPMPEGAREL